MARGRRGALRSVPGPRLPARARARGPSHHRDGAHDQRLAGRGEQLRRRGRLKPGVDDHTQWLQHGGYQAHVEATQLIDMPDPLREAVKSQDATLLWLVMAIAVVMAVALGLSSLLTILLFAQDSLASLALKLFETSEHYTLLAIPFFILGGSFMTTGGVARRMIRFANACIGHLRGGLAMASVLACMLFAAVYLPNFVLQAALRHGRPRSVMHSYTDVDGMPSAATRNGAFCSAFSRRATSPISQLATSFGALQVSRAAS